MGPFPIVHRSAESPPSALRPAALAPVLLLLASGPVAGQGAESAPPPVELFDVAAPVGLDFTYFNGMTGELYMVEHMGGGGALFDYDGDGDLDLYLVQGTPLGELGDLVFPPPHDPPLTDRLYRNDLELLPDGRRRVRLVDVTARAGIPPGGYGMGVAAGDADGDGHLDLYVTNWGPNRLLRNRGDGTFEDATRRAGVEEDRWSVPALFFDMDLDGHLDLYVGNYLDFTLEGHKPCLNPAGGRDYCAPSAYEAVPDRLFRNRGDGTFEDVTAASGLASGTGAALGAVAADLDGDGLPDLYVANDQMPNHLWRNLPDRPGTFTDEALLAGCAVNGEGEAEASMGVVAADLDADGDLDLFLTHLDGETHTLYENLGGGLFADATPGSGLAAPSLGITGFGVAALDADGDGRLDLLVANGAVRTLPGRVQAGDPYPLGQPDQLFLNRGGRNGGLRFAEASELAGKAFRGVGVGRGVMAGDLDGDGDADAVVVDSAGPARLLLSRLNEGPKAAGRRSWLGVVPTDGAGRPVYGAVVSAVLPGGGRALRRAAPDGSYASASDPRALFAFHGSGAAPATVPEVRVRWPGGVEEVWRDLPAGRYLSLPRGGGDRGEGGGASDSLVPIPEPAVAAAEPAVLDQLGSARDDAQALAEGLQAGEAEPGIAARAFGRLGQLFAAYELFPQARAAFENACALAPGSFEWHYYAAYAAQEAGDLPAAEEALGRALEIEPDDRAAQLRLGELLLLQDRFAEALEVFGRAARSGPGAPGAAAARAGQGRAAAAMGETAAAVEHLEAALALDPGATRLHYSLGLAHRDAGDLEAARRHMALRGDGRPQAPDRLVEELAELALGGGFHLVRGDRAMLEGRYRGAVAEYSRAVAAVPESFAYRKALGIALYRSLDLPAAAEELHRALELEPAGSPERRRAEWAEVLSALGTLRIHQARAEEGEEHLRAALALDSGHVQARLELANLLGRSGRVEEAMEELSRLLEGHPGHRVARTKRATALMDLGRFGEALPDLERLVEEAPADAASRARLAASLEGLERWEEARAEYLRILALDGGGDGPRAFAHLRLGRRLEESGRHEDALERYRSLLAEQPGHRGGHRAVAVTLIRLGRYREARERLDESLGVLKGDYTLAQLLARLLAAAPDAEVRDPERAVEIARHLSGISRRSDHAATLAMAEAAAGRFEAAAAAQREALRLAEEGRGPGSLAALRSQLEHYEAERPWRVRPGQDLLAIP